MNAGLVGVGKYVPSHILTNEDLEKRMDTSDEWIRTMTGIEERRIAADDMDTSHMAYHAAVNAIENSGVNPEEIGLILVATVTPDRPFPSVSTMLQEQLGATNAAAMDISTTMSVTRIWADTFLWSASTAWSVIQSRSNVKEPIMTRPCTSSCPLTRRLRGLH